MNRNDFFLPVGEGMPAGGTGMSPFRPVFESPVCCGDCILCLHRKWCTQFPGDISDDSYFLQIDFLSG